MDGSLVGTRIRQRRRQAGLTQAELARRIGISASYLNLIEWNKRRIVGGLLQRTAEALGLDPRDLDGASERRLQASLTEIAHLPSMETIGVEANRTGELIARFPGWAKGISALARSERHASDRVRILSDRLSNDPFMSETVHRMLTRIAAIRSAADILVEYPDLPDERRDRFNQIVHEESRSLSDIGEALVAYLDKTEDIDGILTPLDEVESLFEARSNRFEEIEDKAAELAGRLTDLRPVSRRARARELCQENVAGVIDEIISHQPQIRTSAARRRARRTLLNYAVGAVLMPMHSFAQHAAEFGYDLEQLAEVYSAEFETVCHRLTALPAADGVPRFGYFQANASGTIIEMHSLDGLALPRYASACPLWVLYRAQQSPETVIRQRALFPSGGRFVFVARARHAGKTGFGKPRHYVTDMIAVTEAGARHTVYAPDASAPLEDVGLNCRMCPRRDCLHRVEDPLGD